MVNGAIALIILDSPLARTQVPLKRCNEALAGDRSCDRQLRAACLEIKRLFLVNLLLRPDIRSGKLAIRWDPELQGANQCTSSLSAADASRSE